MHKLAKNNKSYIKFYIKTVKLDKKTVKTSKINFEKK